LPYTFILKYYFVYLAAMQMLAVYTGAEMGKMKQGKEPESEEMMEMVKAQEKSAKIMSLLLSITFPLQYYFQVLH